MEPPPLFPLLFGALLLAPSAPTVQVTVGVVLPAHNLRSPFAWPRVAPALSLAREALQPQLGLAVRTAFAPLDDEDGVCHSRAATFKAGELKGSHRPDVLLGLSCSELNELPKWYRRPLLLRAGLFRWSDYAFSASRMEVLAEPDFSAFHARLHRRFNWTSGAVLVYRPQLLSWQPDRGTSFRFIRMGSSSEEPPLAVHFVQREGRVVYIFGWSLEMVQEFMYHAQAQNMTNGDYVFIYLDPYGESLRAEGHREAAKPWQSKEGNDTGGLREAFQTVLVMTPHEPQTPQYRHFESQLILRAQREFGVAINDSLGHLVAGYFHDGLLLYLTALNETLREGGAKRNTSHILEKMRSLKIQGVTGTVSINSDNIREMDIDLWAMRDVESGEFQVVAHYIGSEKRINWTGPIHWKKGGPPLDNPHCVFDKYDPSCVKSECVWE